MLLLVFMKNLNLIGIALSCINITFTNIIIHENCWPLCFLSLVYIDAKPFNSNQFSNVETQIYYRIFFFFFLTEHTLLYSQYWELIVLLTRMKIQTTPVNRNEVIRSSIRFNLKIKRWTGTTSLKKMKKKSKKATNDWQKSW